MAEQQKNSVGKYAPVNGVNLYYEIHGTGKPLIMIHGGFGNFDTLAAISPALIENRQVIGVDLYGHGHTALIDRPIRFEHMADDIVGLIQHLGLEKVDVLGYSLGGEVALQTAIRHPEHVSNLILISTTFKRTGWYPETQNGMASINANAMVGTPMYDAYKKIAPRPEDFSLFADKMRDAMTQSYDWTEAVSALKIPILIIAGDADSFPISHMVEFFNLLGGGLKDAGWNGENLISSQLAILPGASHYNIIFQPDLLLPVITRFLNK